MDEEFLLINCDYQNKELPGNNNLSLILGKNPITGRQDCPSFDHHEKFYIRELDREGSKKKNQVRGRNSLKPCEKLAKDDEVSISRNNSEHTSAIFNCFENFNETDENDLNYLEGTFYIDNDKSCEGTKGNNNVKLLNGVLSHRMSLCSNNPRMKAISSCSSFLRHTVSMQNTCIIPHSNRQLKLTINPNKGSMITSDCTTTHHPQTHETNRKIHLISSSHTRKSLSHSPTPSSSSTEELLKGRTYSPLEDHRYYAQQTAGSPPPAKKRSFMPQFKSSSASTINSSITAFSNSHNVNFNGKKCNVNANNNNSNNNNDNIKNNIENYNRNSSKYGNTMYPCSYKDNRNTGNRRHDSALNNSNNKNNTSHADGHISILETFLRATCPLDPSKGSTGALLATEEVLSEAGVQRGRLRGGRSRGGNFLKKLLTGEVDSETTSGFETGSSTCNTPSPLSITLLSSCSPTSQSSPYSISSPSCSPYSHSPTPDSMETSTLPVDSLLTDGFGLDADLLIDEKGSLNMQLDWQDDSFKLISSLDEQEWIKEERGTERLSASFSDYL